MKNYQIKICFVLVFIIASFFQGCKSIDLPPTEESVKKIASLTPSINESNKIINDRTQNLPSGKDLILNLNIAPINKVLNTLASNRLDDISLYFGYSPNIIKEDKSILGLNYTNYINIDSGMIYLNLKSFKIDKYENNRLNATIEIEGFGKISVDGKYAGIPASVSPDVQLYLLEPVSFELKPSDNGTMILNPIQKKLTLKVKVSIKLLQWNVPWYQEIPLELKDLIKPLKFPVAMKSEIQFPLPASKFGGQQIETVPYIIEFSNSSIKSNDGKINYRTDINFRKK